jgi:hypothetical protein
VIEKAAQVRVVIVLLMAVISFSTPHAGRAQRAGKSAGSVSDAAVSERARALLKQMTVEEKVGQLTQYFKFEPNPAMEKQIAAGLVGSLLFVTDPAEINRLQKLAVEGWAGGDSTAKLHSNFSVSQ